MTKEQKQAIKDLFKDVFYINDAEKDIKNYMGKITTPYYYLRQCYNKYSYNKEKALEYCVRIQSKIRDMDGVQIVSSGIHSYNIFQFTYAINFIKDGKKYCLYITKDKNTLYAEV